MASSFDALKDLELTRDEVDRIGSALKDKEFRKLLVDYVEELKDPENRKTYQREITQLEKERGVDVTFINPEAGYVIKTSVNGSKKGFINICANEHIKKPSSSPTMQNGAKGLQWSLPHCLTPPREDVDKKGVRCLVYDVVFHPDTVYLARNNKAFYDMVNKTACDAVESSFDVKLDIKNMKFPKIQYKGLPHASVIRKASSEKAPTFCDEEQFIMDKVFETMPKLENKSPTKVKLSKRGNDDVNTKYTTPKYVIKHRSHIELEEFTEHKTAKMNTAIPKELVVCVNLPLLKSAADVTLDVTDKTIQLVSEKPAKYKLFLTLPYSVNQDAGNAKFDKDLKALTIVLPVNRKDCFIIDTTRYDSGVESDHGSPTSSSLTDKTLITELSTNLEQHEENDSDFRTNCVSTFLEPDVHYTLPEHNCHIYENVLAFTLHVKNVDESSLQQIIKPDSLHMKFTSISHGFYPVHYAFYLHLPRQNIEADNVSIEVWDNNVVAQITLESCDMSNLQSYFVGIDNTDHHEKYIEEPAILNCVLGNAKPDDETKESELESAQDTQISDDYRETSEHETDDPPQDLSKETEDEGKSKSKMKKFSKKDKNGCNNEVEITETLDEPNEKVSSKAIDIYGAFSESSGDEMSCSYSPSKCKGILKRFSTSRSSVSRSISESGIDDVLWASSFENCHTSLDSVIPEDGEICTSLKKTVRFNDVVSRQLFRSNSSILGQKKKNQRKARNKKRAQERRHSESELSEIEDRKERELKTNVGEENEAIENAQIYDEGKSSERNEIFDLDI